MSKEFVDAVATGNNIEAEKAFSISMATIITVTIITVTIILLILVT